MHFRSSAQFFRSNARTLKTFSRSADLPHTKHSRYCRHSRILFLVTLQTASPLSLTHTHTTPARGIRFPLTAPNLGQKLPAQVLTHYNSAKQILPVHGINVEKPNITPHHQPRHESHVWVTIIGVETVGQRLNPTHPASPCALPYNTPDSYHPQYAIYTFNSHREGGAPGGG